MIYEKLAKIQSTIKAPKGQFNSFGKYHYRSCEDILEAVKPLLNGLVLTLTDDVVMIGDRYYIKATATLTDGKESISNPAYAREENDKKGMDASQLSGATSSYARKYALAGLFLLDDNKDADATNDHGKDTGKKQDTKEQKSDKTDTSTIVGIKEVRKQTGTNKTTGKPWTKYIIKDADDVEYGTFSETDALFAKESIGSDVPVRIVYATTKFGKDLVSITLAGDDDE